MSIKDKKFYPWVVVALLWVVALLNYMDRQMLSTMQSAMGIDIVELQSAEAFGVLMSVFLWIYAIMSHLGHHRRPLESQMAHSGQPLRVVECDTAYGICHHL